jgi:hypothetical protein
MNKVLAKNWMSILIVVLLQGLIRPALRLAGEVAKDIIA